MNKTPRLYTELTNAPSPYARTDTDANIHDKIKKLHVINDSKELNELHKSDLKKLIQNPSLNIMSHIIRPTLSLDYNYNTNTSTNNNTNNTSSGSSKSLPSSPTSAMDNNTMQIQPIIRSKQTISLALSTALSSSPAMTSSLSLSTLNNRSIPPKVPKLDKLLAPSPKSTKYLRNTHFLPNIGSIGDWNGINNKSKR